MRPPWCRSAAPSVFIIGSEHASPPPSFRRGKFLAHLPLPVPLYTPLLHQVIYSCIYFSQNHSFHLSSPSFFSSLSLMFFFVCFCHFSLCCASIPLSLSLPLAPLAPGCCRFSLPSASTVLACSRQRRQSDSHLAYSFFS